MSPRNSRFTNNMDETRRVRNTGLILGAIIALIVSASLIEKHADSIDPARWMAWGGSFIVKPFSIFM